MKGLLACTLAAACLTASAAKAAPHYQVVGRIKAPDALWDYASVDSRGRRLYVGRFGGVLAIDLKTQRVQSVLAPSPLVHGVLPIPGTAQVLATNGEDDTATLFDGRTGRKIAVIKTAAEPDAVIFDAASGLAVVTDQQGDALTLIDPRRGRAVATIPLAGSPEAPTADGRGHLYVNMGEADEIAVIDVAARKVTAHIKLPGCKGPTGIAYDGEARVVISACRNGAVVVADPDTGRVVATLRVDPGPDDVLFDARRNLAFVPSGAGTMAVISISPRRVVNLVEKVPTQAGARTGALDPSDGRIYLPAGRLKASTVPGQMHDLEPGTFEILVLAPR